MKKRFMTFALALLMVLSVLPMAAFASDGGDIDLSGGSQQPKQQEIVKEAVKNVEETPEKLAEPTGKESAAVEAEFPSPVIAEEQQKAASVEKAAEKIEALGAELTQEDSPLLSFSFDNIWSILGEVFRAATGFFRSFFSILFNGVYGA